MRSFLLKKEIVESDLLLNEFIIQIEKFRQIEKSKIAYTKRTKKFYGHTSSEIDNIIDSLKNILPCLEFERDSFQTLHKIFYPVLCNCEIESGTINGNLEKHMQDRLNEFYSRSILSEEYLDIYNKYRDYMEIAWRRNIIKILDHPSYIRKQRNVLAFSRTETIAQRILTVLNGYSTTIPLRNSDLKEKLSNDENCFYFFLKYPRIGKEMEKITSYTGPTLLYDYLHYLPYTKPNTLMIGYNVAEQALDTSRNIYKNELEENKRTPHSWSEDVLNETQNIFKEQATIYLPHISDFFNIQVYNFKTFEQLIYLELIFLVKEKIYMRKCAYCHKFFFFQDTRLKFCEKCRSYNKYLSQKKYSESLAESPAKLAYQKIYNRLSQKIGRTGGRENSPFSIIREKDLHELRPLIKLCDSNQITLEEFFQKLNQIDSKIKAVSKKINKKEKNPPV